MRFGFGRNWKNYVKNHLSDQAVNTTAIHLANFLGTDNLSGFSFLDIGCGSGVHALAALNLGCERLVAFDLDPESVETSRSVLEHTNTIKWALHQGSVLDLDFVSSLGTFDIVYSWGVLHHTGDVWKALENAASCVAPGGQLYIALYEREIPQGRNGAFWLRVKELYNRGGFITRMALEAICILYHWLSLILQGVNPIRFVKNYSQESRGMNYITDVRDWLGGWPMEFVSINDVFRKFCLEGNFILRNLRFGEANTEYLFQKLP
jgi:SAM-dependent methyltransferase